MTAFALGRCPEILPAFAPSRPAFGRSTSPHAGERESHRPRGLGPHPLAAPAVELDRAVRDGDAEGRADGALDQLDLAAMGAHQLGRDGEAEAGAAGAGRALERLEQVRARLLGQPGPVSETSITTTAPSRRPVDADLVARRIVGRARLQRLQRRCARD